MKVLSNLHRVTADTRPARVISGFPGVGKSTLHANAEAAGKLVSDSDSSGFPKDGFPANYIEHIKQKINECDLVLVSSHDVVRAAMVAEGIAFTLVYPNRGLKAEYLRRYRKRGSPEAFVKLLDEKWDEWIDGCERQEKCSHVVLRNPDEYLADVV